MNPTQMVALGTIIFAVCEAGKFAGVQKRWIPLMAVILGVLGGWYFGHDLYSIAGLITSLSVMGGYNVVKKSILGK